MIYGDLQGKEYDCGTTISCEKVNLEINFEKIKIMTYCPVTECTNILQSEMEIEITETYTCFGTADKIIRGN